MFDRDSRYAKTLCFQAPAFSGNRPQVIQPTIGVIEHTVTKEDRLDRNPEIDFGGEFDLGQYVNTIIVIPENENR
jgi:hypothetical protein